VERTIDNNTLDLQRILQILTLPQHSMKGDYESTQKENIKPMGDSNQEERPLTNHQHYLNSNGDTQEMAIEFHAQDELYADYWESKDILETQQNE
jgi:hypothetical protein